MNISIRNGNVIDELKKIPDESIDCVVSSPPYYGLRDYSNVETYSDEDKDRVIELAEEGLGKHMSNAPEHLKSRYYLTEPILDENSNKWKISLKFDLSSIWGGNLECEHEWESQEIYMDNLRFRNPNHKASVGNHKNPEIFSNPNTAISFCKKCGAWKGQLGLEPSYKMYIDHLMLIMKELKRVLKKTGTLFWNMGDSYASSGGANRHLGHPDPKWEKARNGSFAEPTSYYQGIEPKSLMMIPERFAVAMIDDEWILRNKIIWYKRNGMPSSVKDRLSNKWEYAFFFTKSQKYYFDLDSIRKPLAESSIKRISQKNIPNQFKEGKSAEFAKTDPVNNIPKILKNMHNSFNIRVRDAKKGILEKKWGNLYTASDEEVQNYDEKNYVPKNQKYSDNGAYQKAHSGYFNEDGTVRANLSGANPGDVINTPAVRYKSWASNTGHNFTHERKYDPDADGGDFLDIPTKPHPFSHFAVYPETLIEPLIKAGCPPDGVVLDPFAGSGTTGVVAKKLGRSAILVEISPEYVEIIKERLEIKSDEKNIDIELPKINTLLDFEVEE